LLLGSIFHPQSLSLSHVVLISAFFMLVAFGNDLLGIFRLKSSILLGEISFSIYLLHGLVLYILFTQFPVLNFNEIDTATYLMLMPSVAILVVIISSITFLLIEMPCINYGHRCVLTDILNSIGEYASKALKRTIR
jgi:peptidoglycan/LPS O-acetylase OafA/YrhL